MSDNVRRVEEVRREQRRRAEVAELRAEVERLRAAIGSAVSDLREHIPDGCAGPRGNAREGACSECRLAAWLDGLLPAATEEER